MEDVQYVCVASVVGALLLSSVAPCRVLASYSNDVIMVTVNCAWLRPVFCGNTCRLTRSRYSFL